MAASAGAASVRGAGGPFAQRSVSRAVFGSTILANIRMCCVRGTARRVTVRFVEPRDAEALQHYFRSLTTRSRYNRFFGAISELPAWTAARLHPCWGGGGAAEPVQRGRDHAGRRFRDHRRRSPLCLPRGDIALVEFGLSVDDRWQGHGIGTALLKNLECRAAAFGAAHVLRRHAALQRRHDRARPQVRLRLRQHIPATGSWCASTSRSRSHRKISPVPAGVSQPLSRQALCPSARGLTTEPGCPAFEPGVFCRHYFLVNTGLRLSMKACTASLWSAVVVRSDQSRPASWSRAVSKSNCRASSRLSFM